MKITRSRWVQAQKFELNDWQTQPNIVKNEWSEIKSKYSKMFKKLESRLHVDQKTKILDVGCGPTCISRLFTKGKHFGIDPLAKKLNLINSLEGIKVIDAPGEDIPFCSNHFDIVVCRNVIDHSYQPKKKLDEICRVLKPSGYFIFSSYVYNPFIFSLKSLSEKLNINRNIGHPHTFTVSSVDSLLDPYFSIIQTHTIYTGQNSHDFGKTVKPNNTIPFLHRLFTTLSKLSGQPYFVKEVCWLCRKISI